MLAAEREEEPQVKHFLTKRLPTATSTLDLSENRLNKFGNL